MKAYDVLIYDFSDDRAARAAASAARHWCATDIEPTRVQAFDSVTPEIGEQIVDSFVLWIGFPQQAVVDEVRRWSYGVDVKSPDAVLDHPGTQ